MSNYTVNEKYLILQMMVNEIARYNSLVAMTKHIPNGGDFTDRKGEPYKAIETIIKLSKDVNIDIPKKVKDSFKEIDWSLFEELESERCPSCGSISYYAEWYNTSNDYQAVCPKQGCHIDYSEMSSKANEKVKDC